MTVEALSGPKLLEYNPTRLRIELKMVVKGSAASAVIYGTPVHIQEQDDRSPISANQN